MSKNNEKCINPWFGFLFIVVICVMITAAIFFGSKGAKRHGKAHLRVIPKKAASQVAFPMPLDESAAAQDKLTF